MMRQLQIAATPGKVLAAKGTREPARRMKMFYNLVWVVVSQVYTQRKIH